MRASHRLDVFLVPTDPDRSPHRAAQDLLAELRAADIVTTQGEPGSNAARWMAGGFARIRVDAPASAVLYTSGAGGFRVDCPSCSNPVTAAFTTAVTAWRDGARRSMICPACGVHHPLESWVGHPPFALGSFALVTVDAMSAGVRPEALIWATERLGPLQTLLRRG